MSQIDKLNIITNLFWFSMVFFIFYFVVFSYFLPLIYQSLKVRELFLNYIIYEILLYDIFYYVISINYQGNLFNFFVRIIANFLKNLRNVNNIDKGYSLKLSVPLLKIN